MHEKSDEPVSCTELHHFDEIQLERLGSVRVSLVLHL
jgi:hypothetical protein